MPVREGVDSYWALAVVRRRLWLIVVCGLLAAATAFVVSSRIPPVYRATTTLLVDKAEATGSSDYSGILASERLANTYSQMLTGRPVLTATIAQLKLNESPTGLASRIKVNSIRDTQLVRVSIDDTDPAQAALISNTISQIFVTQSQKLQAERYSESLASTQEQIDGLSALIDKTQAEMDSLGLEKTQREADLARLESLRSQYHDDEQALQKEHENLRLTAAQFTDNVRVIEGAQAPGTLIQTPYTATVTFLVAQAPATGRADYSTLLASERLALTYSQMLTGREVLMAAISQLGLEEAPDALAQRVRAKPVPNTQLVTLDVGDADPIRAALIANGIAEAFVAKLQALETGQYVQLLANMQARLDKLSAQLAQTQTSIDTTNGAIAKDAAELVRLNSRLLEYHSDSKGLRQSLEDLRLTVAQSADNVSVVEAAQAPEAPVSPRRFMNTALAGLVGVMLGLGCAFLLESTDETIKTPRDVERALGLNTIGSICLTSKADRGLIVAAQPHSAHAEAFRILCINARFYGEHDRHRTILVTSPTGAEGKSFISANLAAALAQTGLSVVAVDADLRRPTLSRYFGFDPRSAGLSNALRSGRVDGLLRTTEAEQLAILTSGTLPANPARLLRSPRMQDVVKELAGRGEVTLIDGPPVLPVSDTALLALRTDGVLLVVRAGRTRRDAAQSAVESLSQAGTPVIGVVLNGVDPRQNSYHASYHEYIADASAELQLPQEQAEDDSPDGTVLERSADAELTAQAPPMLEAPARPQLAGEIQPSAISLLAAHEAATLKEDAADRLPGGVATGPSEKDRQSKYEFFSQRELSGTRAEYLFLDALHKPLPKPRGAGEDVLCAWAIKADGREVLLHIASCNAESYEPWLDFLRDMVRRGLSAPVLATAHGTPGVMRAVSEVFPNSLQQRCLALRIRQVDEEIPRSARAEVMAMVQAAYFAPNLRVAERVSADTLKLYSARYPTAMRSFRNDWETCIAYLRCPPAHHGHIRTTTLLRRSYAEERRRSIGSSNSSDEKESLDRVFAHLWQSSQRWQGIRIGEVEGQQLRLLRSELGLLDG